jgi:hypothetical protein
VTGGETAELSSDSPKIFAAIKDLLTKIQYEMKNIWNSIMIAVKGA